LSLWDVIFYLYKRIKGPSKSISYPFVVLVAGRETGSLAQILLLNAL